MQPAPRSNPLFELTRLIAEAVRALWRKRAAVDELLGCDAPELTWVAQDLGISATDLRALATRDKTAADLLYRRLESLRLDPASVDPAVMRDLQRCCSTCDSKQLCAHELEDAPKGAKWPTYCPNEDTIAAIATDSPTDKVRNSGVLRQIKASRPSPDKFAEVGLGASRQQRTRAR